MPTAGTVVKTSTTTGTSPAAALVNTTPGAVNVLCISANSTGTGVQPQIQTPSGWTLACPVAWKSGSPSHEVAVVYRKYQTGDPTTQAVSIAAAGGGNIAVAPVGFAPGELDGTTIIVSGEATAANASGPTTDVTAALTLGGARYVISVFGNRSGATWSAASDGNVHDPIQAQDRQSSAASIAVCFSTSTTASGAARSLLSSASTSVNNTAIVAFNPVSGFTGSASYAPGVTLTTAGTATQAGAASLTPGAGLSVGGTPATGGAAAYAPGVTLTATAPTPIVQQLTKPAAVQWPAHRNGTYATYGEETLEGYLAAAAQYLKAILEISVWDTSDGVYVCSHDQTLSRVFGDGRTITSTTWAGLSPNGASTTGRPVTTVGGNPLRRLEEVLDALPGRFFIVENKHGTNEAALANLMDAHAGVGYWMFKGPYNDTANALIAAGHGAPMWLYFYNNQTGNLLSTYNAVSGAGVPVVYGWGDFSAAPVPVQSDSDTFWAFVTSHGLMAWAFILGTTAQKSNADSQAAADSAAFNGYMTSNYPALAPNDSITGTAAFGAGVTLSVAGAPVGSGSASFTPGAALSASASLTISAVVPLAAGVSLAAAGSPAAVQAAALIPGAALTAVGSATVPVGVPLAVGVNLAASGGLPGLTWPLALAAGVLLSAAGAPAAPSSAALTPGVALAAAALVATFGVVSLQPGVTLAVTQAGSAVTGAGGLSAGVVLAVAGSVQTSGGAGLSAGVLLSVVGVGSQGEAAVLVAGVTLAAGGGTAVSMMVGLSAGPILSAAGAPMLGGAVGLVAGVVLTVAGEASGVLVLFDGSLLAWRLGPQRWGVREGVRSWAVAEGLVRWLWRALGDDVKVGDRRLVNLQVQSPQPLTHPDVTVTACISQTRQVPDSPVELPVVIPDDYEWPGKVGWATVAAWVGPGLPVGTNYVLTHVTAGGEDFWDVAATVQVEE